MSRWIARLLALILPWKGGEDMMAMLYATRIIAGKLDYVDVPGKLREQVADLLRDAGLPELVSVG